MWVSGVGRLRSGTLVCYGEPSLTSGISHRQCGRTLGPVSDSRPRVCPERAPALSAGDRGPCWRPCPRAGLLGRSPCVHTCAQRAYLCFRHVSMCIHVHMSVVTTGCVCTHTRLCFQVCMHVHLCSWRALTPQEGLKGTTDKRSPPQDALPTERWGPVGRNPASAKPPRDTQRWGQGMTSPLRDGVVPEHADRLGALLGLQEGEFHQDGPLQGAGQRGPLAVNHRAHHRRVDDGPVRQPAGRRQSPGQTCVRPGEDTARGLSGRDRTKRGSSGPLPLRACGGLGGGGGVWAWGRFNHGQASTRTSGTEADSGNLT